MSTAANRARAGVDGDMRFRDDDYSADAMRTEGVKNIGHDRAARGALLEEQLFRSAGSLSSAASHP
jgi:hypothetical protein